jgi:hypothetical protein
MTTTERDQFWLTNRVANPVLGPLLRRRAGRLLGRKLALVRYPGRRTGEPHDVVVQYARAGDQIWIVPGHPEAKRWWRNFETPRHVEVWLAGAHSAAVASVLHAGDEGDEFARGLATYREQLPRATNASAGTAGPGSAARAPALMVRLDLHGTPSTAPG